MTWDVWFYGTNILESQVRPGCKIVIQFPEIDGFSGRLKIIKFLLVTDEAKHVCLFYTAKQV